MDELVKVVADKTGLSTDQARAATQAVLDFLKGKLPAPIASQIDTVLSGGAGMTDTIKSLGGMFGKK